jgi:hypothetical protein
MSDEEQSGEGVISLAEAKRRRKAEKRAGGGGGGNGSGGGGAEGEIGPNDIIVYPGDLPRTARDVRDKLAKLQELFERSGAPVRVYVDADDRLAMQPVSEFDVVNLVHENYRVRQWHVPKDGSDGKLVPVTLPQRVARLYLAMVGTFGLRPLVGITDAPLLSDNGSILMGAK